MIDEDDLGPQPHISDYALCHAALPALNRCIRRPVPFSCFALIQVSKTIYIYTPMVPCTVHTPLQAKWELQEQAAILAELRRCATESEKREESLRVADADLKVSNVERVRARTGQKVTSC